MRNPQPTANLRWRLARSRRKAQRREARDRANIAAIRHLMAAAGIEILPWQTYVLDRVMDPGARHAVLGRAAQRGGDHG